MSKAAKKVVNVLASGAEEINKLFIPGYGAYREGRTPLEVITSATCDLAITLCGGKVIKIGWQGAKAFGSKIGAKIASTLQPTRQVAGVGNVRAVPDTNNNFYKVYNNNINTNTRVANNININNNVNSKVTNLNLDAQNKAPYNARAMEELLRTQNPNAKVTSSTLPKPNQNNVRLAGKHIERTVGINPETQEPIVQRVVFNQKGFPIFDPYVKLEVKISGNLSNMRSTAHQKLATIELKKLINSGQVNKNMFTAEELININNEKPKISKAYTWHHHQDTGRMQLVPSDVHNWVKHAGGNILWGSGK